MGVRTASTITASGISNSSVRGSRIVGRSESETADSVLVPAQVMSELVAHGAGDLRLEELGVVAEVTQQRVAEDHDAVVEVVVGDGVSLVEAVGALAASALRDDHRDVLERTMKLEGQVV